LGKTNYLVTARHVIEQLSLGEWVLRANVQQGGLFEFRGGKDYKWWFHPSEADSVDVAVTPLPRVPDHEYLAIAESMFLDDRTIAETGIGVGDDVYMTGLFNRVRGRSRNLPIVRMGNISLIPDAGELVPGVKMQGRGVDADVYLIEARSLGGLSGSPAFVRTTVEMDVAVWRDGLERKASCLAPGETFLLGLVHGHWEVHKEDINESHPRFLKKTDKDAVNMGIAIVVPAKKIREVLYHPELVEMRRAWDKEANEAEGVSCPD
jgi:hypothetical protein